MNVSIPKALEPDVKEFANALCLTPRQFVLQAVEREIERLRGEKVKYLKVRYGTIHDNRSNDSQRRSPQRGSSPEQLEEHQEVWSL